MNKFYVALLCTFMADALCAQSPGGIGTANLSVWLKPDGLTAGPLSTWTYANNSNSYTAGPTAPSVVTNAFNFWPAVNFNGGPTSYMTGPSGASAPLALNQLAYAVFAVWSSPQAVGGGNMRVWTQRESGSGSAYDGISLFIYPGAANNPGASYATSGPTYGDQPENSPFTTGVSFPTNTGSVPYQWTTGTTPATTAQSILTYTPNTSYISSLNLLSANTNDLELMDQNNYGPTPAVTSTDPNAAAITDRLLSDQENMLGARTTTAADENFNGNLAELIVVNTSVTATQRQQIFSYLALKYGIPLAGSYISSGGGTFWDAAANGAYGFGTMNYNHFVFGLGEDLASGLTTNHSNSSSTGSGGGTGQSGLGNIVLANPSSLADQGFMLVGSNDAGFTETNSNIPGSAPAGAQRLSNQWLIQNSGTVGAVDLSFDFTGITTTGAKGTSADFRLVVDNDGDGDFTTGTQDWYQPASWDGTNQVATFSQVNLSKSSKVVISILSSAPVGTPLPVNWVNFTAKGNGPDVDLSWTVSANESAKVYDVQRSENGTSFSSVGQVSNQPSVNSYGFVDANAGPGTHYYRVLETDQDGKSIYSKIVSVNMTGSDFGVRLLNNPVVNGTDAELEITAVNSGNASLEIWALGGARVATMMQSIPNGTSRIRLPMANLATGTYAVKIRVNDVTQTVQVVKL